MENNKELYAKYEHERKNERAVPEFDLIKYMENYKKNVDFYNSYGLKQNDHMSPNKIPLGEAKNRA